jgi:para-aminobenzoate synthetase / 4-amino-4-deoxychorismate lyase
MNDPSMTQWTRLPAQAHKLAAENPGAVLLETSRPNLSNSATANRHSYLFLKPISTLVASDLNEIPQLFAQIEAELARGNYVAGFFSYECGYHFEHSSAAAVFTPEKLPLAWFGVYPQPIVFHHESGHCENGDLGDATQNDPVTVTNQVALGISEEDYRAKILQIQRYIAAGDTYQVNFTDNISFQMPLPADAIYQSLSQQQPVAYSAFLNLADRSILSFSPELFFRREGNRIVTRPMKGTMARGLDLSEDAEAAQRLHNDEKNRSEHVMIVDLLRNDLGRICTMGSVRVEDLFSVEKYQTLLQMTSTVSGSLQPGIRYYDIFHSLFPSGSVTGAPKIRTMQIIRELEHQQRGVYTGAIGFFAPHHKAVFNVAIRTLVLQNNNASMGVGGGIVADSDPLDEYKECLLKASFLTRAPQNFQLIETMLWDKEYFLLSLHMGRMEASAAYFNFRFHRAGILSRLNEQTKSFEHEKKYRVRLLLNASGDASVESFPLTAELTTIQVQLSKEQTSSSDVFLRHKTTRREIYDRELAKARAQGFDEVIFTNERGEVTEGAISNLFIERSGKLLTPPLASGVLPGILRRHLFETARAEEQTLTLADLKSAEAVFLGNSVRGLRRIAGFSRES